MSKRARAIDLWATIKSLGRIGIDEMVSGFHRLALKMAEGLRKEGFIV